MEDVKNVLSEGDEQPVKDEDRIKHHEQYESPNGKEANLLFHNLNPSRLFHNYDKSETFPLVHRIGPFVSIQM